ncbi:MAG: ATP-dependent DNA helicase RecG [Ignavibacteriae bacterium]|nr:MAG: ATP-dependent DNA helicase RecG [Ignavibacteriota bacterium]
MLSNKSIDDSIQYLSGVGPKKLESFSQIGITTIENLLFFFPSKYLDRSNILTVQEILHHILNEYDGELTVVAEVIHSEIIHYSKRQIFKVQFQDNSGEFEAVWFKGINYFKTVFNKSNFFVISGKPVLTKYGNLQFIHPDFDKFTEEESKGFTNTGKIIPFYSISKELKNKKIGDIGLRKIISNAIKEYSEFLTETLPKQIINENNLLSINKAVANIHFPENEEILIHSKNRFKFEELFYLEILVAIRKYKHFFNQKGISFNIHKNILIKFLNTLPFNLTEDQLKVLSEIKSDMQSTKPMNRLLQGDVGSGKTIVAVISALIAASNGYQTVIMAPTEILAAQHFISITNLLSGINISLELLIGGTTKKEKEAIKENIKNGKTQILIGTHALIEGDVEFNNLGLVIIDEQHRFGVAHRSRLINKGNIPDVLIMTATPIPRTLTMTLYGDLDVSLIKKMPKNRIKIKTALRGEESLPDIYKFIIEKNKEDYQTYIVYPLVEESEKLELKAAEVYYNKLKESYFKDLKIGLLHGRMSWKEKDEVMHKFKDKEFDVLISTTVIEVGIDIPDANIIVINNAERFGLSQLHQLRGRVGRSNKQAYCILVTKNDLAKKTKNFNFNFDYLSKAQIDFHKSKIRLNAMVKYSGGFDLSEVDLKLRGPGDIFGKMQSGFPNLQFADLTEDYEILLKAKEAAFDIIEHDPTLIKNENFMIKKKLNNYYKENLDFSFVG